LARQPAGFAERKRSWRSRRPDRGIARWWQTFLNSFGVNEVAVTGSIAMGAVAEELPHGDPADRIVVATARSLGAKLLTADKILRETIPFVVW
jgi:PIN domain nuclease of toxin-antitoxin system